MTDVIGFPRTVPEESSIYVMERLGIEDLKKGAEYEVLRTVHFWNIFLTALVSRDFNRLHWDPFFARRAGYRTIVAHGILLVGFLSASIARIMRQGCRVSDIDAKFRRGVCAGDEVHIHLKIVSVNRRGYVQIEVEVKDNKTGEQVASGNCSVWLLKEKDEPKRGLFGLVAAFLRRRLTG